jgi:hypothetical protein
MSSLPGAGNADLDLPRLTSSLEPELIVRNLRDQLHDNPTHPADRFLDGGWSAGRSCCG